MPSEIIVEFSTPLTDKEKKMIYGYKGEVVRCRDCKHNYYNMIPSGEADYGCTKYIELPITADFYCAWGEREDDK